MSGAGGRADLGGVTKLPPLTKTHSVSLPSMWAQDFVDPRDVKMSELERVINQQIMAFMTDYNVDSPTQHAYRQHKSCVSAWTDLDSFVMKSRDAGRVTVILLTDQSSAFNVLDRTILIPKLKILGFKEVSRRKF